MEAERRPPRPPPPQRHSLPEQSLENMTNTFRDLQRLHDSAHRYIEFGLQADERGSLNEAIESYSNGLQLLNDAMAIDCENLSSSSQRKDQAKEMQQKMMKTKQQITFRLQTLESERQDGIHAQARITADAPPSYDQATNGSNINRSSLVTESDLEALGNSIMNDEPDSLNLTNTVNLYSIEEGVQIFYISPEGYVSAPSYPSALHVLRIEDETAVPGASSSAQRPPAFIHVGDWLYPLVPGSSPVLQTNFGAYMFPDLMSSQIGSTVGLILPQSMPAKEREKFEKVVRSFTLYQQQPAEAVAGSSSEEEREPGMQVPALTYTSTSDESTDLSAKISHGILVAADWISWGVGKGAEKAGELIRTGSEKLQDRINPSEKEHKMDPRLQKGLVFARQATHKSVQVTGYLVNKLGETTAALAKQIAPHIRSKGEKFIPKSLTKESSNGKSKLDGVVEVAASGLQGVGTVYVGLESAAKTLGRSLANETVHIVQHKYGEEAGNMAENSMYAAGNVAMTALNARNFGLKAMAKRTAKDTGKAIVNDMNMNRSNKQGGYNPCENDLDDSYTNDNGGKTLVKK